MSLLCVCVPGTRSLFVILFSSSRSRGRASIHRRRPRGDVVATVV